ncbi:MAG: hypothetical protein AABY18_02360 [Candidatus Thermoplasmatota archaeon]
MRWQVISLKEFEDDVASLARSGLVNRAAFIAAVVEQFEDPFKARRLDHFLTSGSPTAALDRLASSLHPPSIRLQVQRDFRVTAWCYTDARHVVVTHAFVKSSDPDYRRAARIHDDRLTGYVRGMQEFLERLGKR